jgi:prepilin-type processing-associated H-X9-DG protein
MQPRQAVSQNWLMKRIDLLALILVLTALAALATPQRTRTKLRSLNCAENLRRLGLASQLYTIDHADHLPGCQHSLPSWTTSLKPYCDQSAFVCPKQKQFKFSISLNDFLTPHPHGAPKLDFSLLSCLPNPAGTLMFAEAQPEYLNLKFDHFHFADARENGFIPPRFRAQVDVERHGSGANYLFPDAHLEMLPWRRAQNRLSSRDSIFVHPLGPSASRTETFPFIASR